MEPLLTLKASAGSGKTFALAVRYIALMLKGADPRRIVALTFTNKAASEMRERIEKVLFGLGNPSFEGYIKPLMQESGLSLKEIHRLRPLLIDRFTGVRPKIVTIDAFCVGILRQFAWFGGLNPRFDVGSEGAKEVLAPFLQEANEAEREVLFYFQALYGQSPDKLFAFLEELFAQGTLFDPTRYPLTKTTYAKEEAWQLALKLKTAILDIPEVSSQAQKGVDYASLEELITKGSTWLPRETLAETRYFKKLSTPSLEALFTKLKEALPLWFEERERELLGGLAHLSFHYATIRRRRYTRKNKLDFTDTLDALGELLREHDIPNDFLYFRLDGRIDHLLIDEFQDTSIAQYRLLEPIIDEICAGSGQGGERTLFAVGDPKQAIYRFRGANADVFEWLARQTKRETLGVNYRSTPEVVSYVNDIFRTWQGYFPQECYAKTQGFVRSLISQEPLREVIEQLRFLFHFGCAPHDIAILAQTNGDLLVIEENLRQSFPDVAFFTETSSKLTEHREVQTLIFGLKALYFRTFTELDEKSGYYDALFIARLGGNPQSSWQPPLFNAWEKPSLLTKKLMQHYALLSAASYRFLEIIAIYDDLPSLIDALPTLSEPIPPQLTTGVTLMTVHKSKGLEFPHVIIMDRLGNRGPQPSPLLFTFQGLHLTHVSLRLKAREEIDSRFRTISEYEQLLSDTDRYNRLYVALTRAKESLIVIAKDKGGMFEPFIIRHEERGIMTQRHYKPQPFREHALPAIVLQDEGRQKEFVKRGNKTIPTSAIRYGIALHDALSCLPFVSQAHTKRAQMRLKRVWEESLGEDTVSSIMSRLDALTHSRAFTALWEEGKLWPERSFMKNGEVGRIDLFIEKEDEVLIIDYKSSAESLAENTQQVNFYTKVAGQLTGKKARGFIVVCETLPRIIEVTA